MRDRRLTIISISTIALAILALVLALFIGVGTDTAPVLLPSAGGSTSGDGGSFATVTPSTVQAVIETLSRPDSYSRTAVAEDFWDGGSGATQLRTWVSGGKTRINILRGGVTENILVTEDGVWIWYDNADGVFHSAEPAEDGDADLWMRAVSYERLLDLPAEDISGAGYTRFAGESCIWAEYVTGEFGYRERAYVCVNNGILMGVETYDGDRLIYRLTSGSPSVTTQDESLFTPPKTD